MHQKLEIAMLCPAPEQREAPINATASAILEVKRAAKLGRCKSRLLLEKSKEIM